MTQNTPLLGTTVPKPCTAIVSQGDAVLLCFNEQVELEQFELMVTMLEGHFPGVKWGMVENVTGVLVKKGNTE